MKVYENAVFFYWYTLLHYGATILMPRWKWKIIHITVTLFKLLHDCRNQAFLPVDNTQQFLFSSSSVMPQRYTTPQSGGAPTESLEHRQNSDNPPTTNQTRPEDTGPTWGKIAGLVSGHCKAHPRDSNVKGVSLKACFLSHTYSFVKPNYS